MKPIRKFVAFCLGRSVSKGRNNNEDGFKNTLKRYLSSMTAEAQNLLIRSLEQAKVNGEASERQEMMLEALRDRLLGTGQMEDGERPLTAERAFFMPSEPFLLSEAMAVKQPGRIRRSSLRPLWIWLTRDLARGDITEALTQLQKTVATHNKEMIDRTACQLRKQFAAKAKEFIAKIEAKHGTLRPLASQIGSISAMEDLHEWLAVIDVEMELDLITSQLPIKMGVGRAAFDQIDRALDVMRKTQGSDKSLYAIGCCLSVMPSAADLVRYAVSRMHTDQPHKIRQSFYAPCISLTLSEIERFTHRILDNLAGERSADFIIQNIRHFDDLVDADAVNIVFGSTF